MDQILARHSAPKRKKRITWQQAFILLKKTALKRYRIKHIAELAMLSPTKKQQPSQTVIPLVVKQTEEKVLYPRKPPLKQSVTAGVSTHGQNLNGVIQAALVNINKPNKVDDLNTDALAKTIISNIIEDIRTRSQSSRGSSVRNSQDLSDLSARSQVSQMHGVTPTGRLESIRSAKKPESPYSDERLDRSIEVTAESSQSPEAVKSPNLESFREQDAEDKGDNKCKETKEELGTKYSSKGSQGFKVREDSKSLTGGMKDSKVDDEPLNEQDGSNDSNDSQESTEVSKDSKTTTEASNDTNAATHGSKKASITIPSDLTESTKSKDVIPDAPTKQPNNNESLQNRILNSKVPSLNAHGHHNAQVDDWLIHQATSTQFNDSKLSKKQTYKALSSSDETPSDSKASILLYQDEGEDSHDVLSRSHAQLLMDMDKTVVKALTYTTKSKSNELSSKPNTSSEEQAEALVETNTSSNSPVYVENSSDIPPRIKTPVNRQQHQQPNRPIVNMSPVKFRPSDLGASKSSLLLNESINNEDIRVEESFLSSVHEESAAQVIGNQNLVNEALMEGTETKFEEMGDIDGNERKR